MTTGLNGLPAGNYACRTDDGQFVTNMAITAAGNYTGQELGGVEAPLSYDPGTGMVTFIAGDFFTAPGAVLSQHFIGQYPSPAAGDPRGTILLSELPGYPNDSDRRPALQGSATGLWHCTPSSGSATSTAPTTSVAATTAPSSAVAMSVPFGIYSDSGHLDGLRMGSDGTYAIGPRNNPDSGQSGSYEVIDNSSIKFDTGPYTGLIGGLFPNYKGSGRSYIDLVYQGTTISWQYYHA